MVFFKQFLLHLFCENGNVMGHLWQSQDNLWESSYPVSHCSITMRNTMTKATVEAFNGGLPFNFRGLVHDHLVSKLWQQW